MEKIELQNNPLDIMEGIIEQTIKVNNQNPMPVIFSTNNIIDYEIQMHYYLTLITILYKQKQLNKSIEYKTKDTRIFVNHQRENENIDIINTQLQACIENKDIINATRTIMINIRIINEILYNYFKNKNKNYIMEKEPLHIIEQTGKIKEILKINPYVINQYIQYLKKPTTKYENIICDLLQIKNIVDNKKIINQGKTLIYFKQILPHLYTEDELEEIIIFIMTHTYQESIYRNNKEIFQELNYIIEDERIKSKYLKEYFESDDRFSNIVLSTFFKYTTNIEPTRLKELEQQPSYKYVKQRLKKPN